LNERVGKDNGPENALWYFREDIHMNFNHLIWHSYYAYWTEEKIARRGEFFYYFHHQDLNR